MPQFQEEFIEAVMKDCLLAATSVRKLIFQLRFTPKKKALNHKEIAALAKKQLAEAGTIYENNELKEIIRALVDTFEAQMIKDNVNIELLRSNEPGKKGKWQLVYDWLWDKYYPNWLLEQQWQKLVDKADKTENWLQVKEVTPVERNFGRRQLPKPTIPLGIDINLIVNWS